MSDLLELGTECVEHARMFFNRPDFYLASARPPTYRAHAGWRDA